MNNQSFLKSQDYEFFIRLARNCDNGIKFGADYRFMENLIDKELNDVCVKHLNHKKLLTDVKKYMNSATKFKLKQKLKAEDKVIVNGFLDRIYAATTSDELLAICKEGRALFAKNIPNSPSI